MYLTRPSFGLQILGPIRRRSGAFGLELVALERRCLALLHGRLVYAGGELLREHGRRLSLRVGGSHEAEEQRLDDCLLVGVEAGAIAGHAARL